MGVTLLLLAAIVAGSALGLSGVSMAGYTDPTILLLVILLFFELRLRAVTTAFANLRFIGVAWAANFVIIPMVGMVIASVFLSGQPLLFTGLVLYFLAPCTDWFLGFTRMARGDTALGAALVPINMVTQLLLYPLWLWAFTREPGIVDLSSVPDLLWHWFFIPFVTAQLARLVLGWFMPLTRLVSAAGRAVPWVTAALIVQIFADNVVTITAHLGAFGIILVAICLFFVATYAMGQVVSRIFRLSYPEHALMAMTTAARNAPLMLALTVVAMPEQPLVYAALIIGMLVEFPHLTALKQILSSSRQKRATA